MKVSSQHLRLDTHQKTAELQGYKGGARQLLREMAADLVGPKGTVRSGYLRLSESGSEVSIKAGHLGSGATAATGLIKDLVKQAYGEQASQALETYLGSKRSGHNKVGTQSFVKLIQKLEADVSEFRTNLIDDALLRAQVSTKAALRTDSIASLKLAPDLAGLLGKDRIQAHDMKTLESDWMRGLQLLFPGSEVKRLGAGSEAITFEIKDDQGAQRVYKAKMLADNLQYVRAREQDVGAIYSSGLRQSPYLLTPSHFVMGYGDGSSAPQTVVRVPAERVKELAKESNLASKYDARWLIYGLEMPKAQGRALDAQGQALTHQDLGHIARGLHAGLSDLAAHHAIHCDIKPENVMYNPADGRVQLIDFGGLQKLSKHDAPQGQKPMADSTPTATAGYTPAWLRQAEKFGIERDRYAAAVTLLAAVLTDPKDGQGKDATVSEMIIKALGEYTRAADRPEAVLDDVLAQFKTQNPAMHEQLDRCLQRSPQFRDYLGKMFASAVPGRHSDAMWKQLKNHPFVTAPLVFKEMTAAELTTPAAARARADRVLNFFKNADPKDFIDLNAISGSTLVWAVHTDPALADTRVPMADREKRFRELEQMYHEQKPAVYEPRDPAVETEQEYAQRIQENLQAAALSRAQALPADLSLLNDPQRCALLNRTVVQARQVGLKAEQIDILGRGKNLHEAAMVPDERVDALISRIFERHELDQEDIRWAGLLFPEISDKLVPPRI